MIIVININNFLFKYSKNVKIIYLDILKLIFFIKIIDILLYFLV